MYRQMKTVVEIIESLKVDGYIYEFSIKDNALYCNSTESKYNAKDLLIEKTERYEGDSDPSDNVIVYGITAKDGSKGTLIDSYGVYSDPHFAILIDEIPLKEVHELQDNK
jgi:hypothetical protein